MAVFTVLNKQDVIEIIDCYDVGGLVSFKGIESGVENTNYFIQTDKDRFILTIYEKRVDEKDLPFFLNLKIKLNQLGINCPVSIKDKKGEIIGNFRNKKFSLINFLEGEQVTKTNNNEVRQAGKMLAQLHLASSRISDKELFRENTMSLDFWQKTYKAVEKETKVKFKYISNIISDAFYKVEHEWPESGSIERGIIHADFFPDNMFIKDKKAHGVIDFYMACNDFYAYDLAIAINAWCFEKDHSFNITKANIFLKSYNKFRKLSNKELELLPVLCIGASLRFLSTRLYDFFNTDKNALIKVKNPAEYMEKLKFHMQVKNHHEYGL